jgi:hypothetical protein
MVLCNYCDYLKKLSYNDDSSFCIMYVCEYSNYTFTDINFDELIEYPCCILSNPFLNINTDLKTY